MINQNVTQNLPDYPIDIYGATGVNLNNLPTICGGKSSDGFAKNVCFQYDILNETWNNLNEPLQKPRFQSAASISNGHFSY